MSQVVLYRGGRSGVKAAAARGKKKSETSNDQILDDFEIIEQLKNSNIPFTLPPSTRSRLLREISTPYEKPTIDNACELKEIKEQLAEIQDGFKMFKVVGNFSLSFITSNF